MKTLPRVLIPALMLVLQHGVLAEESFKADDDLGRVREQIETTHKTYTALQAVRNALENQLAEIEKRNGDLARTIQGLETGMRERDGRIAGLKRRQSVLQVSIREQQTILAGQLRSAQVTGRHDWLKLLMNQEEPSIHARVLAYYGYLVRARSDRVERLTRDMAENRKTADELSKESESQGLARKDLALQRSTLSESVKARRLLLTGWNRELRNQSEDLVQLRENERRLQQLIQSVEAERQVQTIDPGATAETPTPQARAVIGLCPPVGAVKAHFGDSRMSGRWDGLLIGGREGAPVRAAVSGKVVFADWLRGYGLLLIVDHGDGVMSLYAFNQTLYKGVGDSVAPGDLVAAMGVSGGRSSPGLYFGIREKGQAVDPAAWCNRVR